MHYPPMHAFRMHALPMRMSCLDHRWSEPCITRPCMHSTCTCPAQTIQTVGGPNMPGPHACPYPHTHAQPRRGSPHQRHPRDRREIAARSPRDRREIAARSTRDRREIISAWAIGSSPQSARAWSRATSSRGHQWVIKGSLKSHQGVVEVS